jgi:hypothetical protein
MSENPTVTQSRGVILGLLFGIFLAALGIDFVFHAGLLAHFYLNAGPSLLSRQLLFRRIPFGYASILLTLAFELWLMRRFGVLGARAGTRFGAVFGGVMGVAGSLGLFSVVPFGASFLVGIAVCQLVEYTLAGALLGSGLESKRVLRVIVIGSVVFIIGVAAGLAMQATGFAPSQS